MTAPALTDFFGLEGGPEWRLQVTDEICNAGGTLWGGIGLGAAMEAIERETGRFTVWAAVQYIRPIHPGARLDLTVDVVRAGRQLTQAQVSGLSAGELAFSCMASLGPRARVVGQQPEGASQEPWRHGVQFVRIPADVSPPDQCPVRKIPVEMGTRRKLPDHFEQRWASPPRATPFDGTPGSGRTRLWLRFEQAIRPEERTGAALAVLADLAPSAIAEAVGVIAGGVSLDNTIRIARQWIDTGAAEGAGTDGHSRTDGLDPARRDRRVRDRRRRAAVRARLRPGGSAARGRRPVRHPATFPARRVTGMAKDIAAPPMPSEAGKLRELRRMKAGATLLLVAFAVMYAIAYRWQRHGAPGWVGYWAAATEAGMVGALADWFAVTALFRRPLGLPIPHTAIIPTRKDALGRSLQEFVADNFLSGDVVRDRVSRAGIPLRVGTWLSARRSADRVVGEAATAMRAVVDVLHDDDVQEVLEHSLVRRLLEPPWGPPAGQLLQRIVSDGTHHRLVDLAIDETHRWLLDNDETVLRVVRDQAPAWTPAFVDTAIALRVYTELVRFVGEVRVDPQHRSRIALDAFLTQFASDLQNDPDTIAAAEQAKQRVLEHPEFRKALTAVWSSVKAVLLAAADDPNSELRQRASLGLMSLGERIVADAALRTKLDGWIGDALTHVVTTYRDEVATVISDTVGRWDADETSRRIEIQVGRDLQYIRINGTVVGALAGLAIHAISVSVF